MEPPMKKQKHEIEGIIQLYIDKIKSNDKNLIPVVADSLKDPIPLIEVTIGIINNVTDISTIIKVLNEKLPLKELSHLKRVKVKSVLLCPKEYITGNIQNYMETYFTDICHMFSYFQVISVPMYSPKTRLQFESVKKLWSCNFHPNPDVEKLVSDNYFNKKDLKRHKSYMELVFHVLQWYIEHLNIQVHENIIFDHNVTIVVNPMSNSIVAVTFDSCQNHPLQHSAMLAIDKVARTQGGGVWSEVSNEMERARSGIDKELLDFLIAKHPGPGFGVKDAPNGSALPYLCTGYVFYMLKEPCIMCAMGMVHARVKQVFFALPNDDMGALVSRTKLHTILSLNHHFEVFTGFLPSNMEDFK